MSARVPPHDLDAEAAVLSAAILDPSQLDEMPVELTAAHFYSPANGLIFGAIVALREEGSPVDLRTIASWLKQREKLSHIGGGTYLAHVVDAAPAVENLTAYANAMLVTYRKRQVLQLAQKLQAEAYGDVGDVDDWADKAAHDLTTIATSGANTCDYEHIGKLLRESERERQDARANHRPPLHFPSGIKSLDDVVQFRPGELVVVGAPSGVGKTSLVGGFAMHVAHFAGWQPELRLACPGERPHVLFMALEMKAIAIAERLWCGAAQVPRQAWLRDRLDGDGYDRMNNAFTRLGEMGLYVGYRPRLTLADLKRNVRACARESREIVYDDAGTIRGRLRFVVLDYLGLMDIPVAKGARPDEAIGRVVWEMKQIAEEEQLCFVCISQLNRMYAQRAEGRPSMADLRGSGQIEHTADTILFAHREDAVDHTSALKGFGEIIVAKQRNGESATTVPVRWRPEYTMYEELSTEDRWKLLQIQDERRAKAGRGKR